MDQTSPDELEEIVDGLQNDKSSDISIYAFKNALNLYHDTWQDL